MSAFHPILNEAYARQRIADYRRSQAAMALAQSTPRPSRRFSRISSILTKRLDDILVWSS